MLGTFPIKASPESVSSGDINGDGFLDSFTANSIGYDISALLGNGDGTFQSVVNYTVDGFPVSSGDVNNDGFS